MKKTICDRCEKEIPWNGGEHIEIVPFSVLNVSALDLCNKCIQHLKDFLNPPKAI